MKRSPLQANPTLTVRTVRGWQGHLPEVGRTAEPDQVDLGKVGWAVWAGQGSRGWNCRTLLASLGLRLRSQKNLFCGQSWGCGLQKTLFWTQGKVPEAQTRVFQGVAIWCAPQKRVFQRVSTLGALQKTVFQGVSTWGTLRKTVFQGVGTLSAPQKRVFQGGGILGAPQKRVFQEVGIFSSPQKRVFQGRGTFPCLQKTIGSRMGAWLFLGKSWFFETFTPPADHR